MDDIATYRAKARDLRARAAASETAAEAAGYLELAEAWERLVRAFEDGGRTDLRLIES